MNMITISRRILAFLVMAALILSMFPVMAMAEESVDKWKQISFADIKEADTILISMKIGSKYYMITTDQVTTGSPLAFEATVNTEGEAPVLETTGVESLYGWNFIPAGDGFQIKSSVKDSGLYLGITSASNTGVRISTKATSVWNLTKGYLHTPDTKEVVRYLGVYKNQDWRSYTNTNNNIAGQETVFWVLTEGDGGELETKAKGVKVDLTPDAYITGTALTLTSKEEGASVYYHTGDENWTLFTDPIIMTESVNITAKSVKDGMRDSDPESFAYTIFTVGEETATLVRDMAELAPGDQILIVALDKDRALGKNQKNNNRDIGYVVKDGETCTFSPETQILTLEAGMTDDTYSFYAEDGNFSGYLYVPMADGNYLRSNEEKDESASFRITIDEEGRAHIVGTEAKLQNTIFYLHGSVKVFSCYASTSDSAMHHPVGIYKIDGQKRPGLPNDGDTVLIYNVAARGTLSDVSKTNGVSSIKSVPAKVEKTAVNGSNGSLLFTVEKTDSGYLFYNESFGYLCAGSSIAYYSEEAISAAEWELEAYNGGYIVRSLAVPEHILQYTSGKFAAYGTSMVHTRDGLTYHFYPCNNPAEEITDGVVNTPQVVFGSPSPAMKGQNYQLNFSVDAIFGVAELRVNLGETELTCNLSYGRYSAVIPAEMVEGETLSITVEGMDNKNVAISGGVEIPVKDEPLISDLQPVPNSQTKGERRPTISAAVTNAGENPTVTMTLNGMPVDAVYEDGRATFTPVTDLATGTMRVTLTITRQDGKSVSKNWSFVVGEARYDLMFGQLHSHTGEYSDGSGTLQSALEYIESLPYSANVDFVAFTDHSNYFDTSDAPNPPEALYDLSLATKESAEKWSTYKNTMLEFNQAHVGGVIAIPGFEMTWSGGPGHINTFVTEGIVSRNNKTLNNKLADAGMRAYYELLTRPEGEEGISQLNHPGTSFGNFTDFAYWNPEVDSRVYLVEVGNGEGPVRGGGYYPSYEQYTLALDKGWHVAPTNNQDNHKGKWGNANNARDVLLVEEFTEEGIYDAIRSYRVYATEDKNLEIKYTVNELPMGTIIENVPDVLEFKVTLKDPDATDTITSVELIVNSGKVAYTWSDPEELASGTLTVAMEPGYSYYFIKVTQADKDIAVTAPVWVGEALKMGIRESKVSADIAVVGEELTISTNFYNEEMADAVIKSIVYTTNGSEVLHVDNELKSLSAGQELLISWNYTPLEAKQIPITITAVVEYDGREYTFTSSVELNVEHADQVTYLGIDASHFNEYVTGKYSQMMNNFTTLATQAGIRAKQLTSSGALIAACMNEQYTAIVLNVPSRQLSQARSYSQQELDALAAFRDRGGILIISNLGDKFDKLDPHMAATQNALLEALGSSLRFADDSVRAGSFNSVYCEDYGNDPLTTGCEDAVVFYNGSSIYAVDETGKVLDTLPENVGAVLYGNYKSESVDDDGDGLGGDTMTYTFNDDHYGAQSRLLLMATDRQEGKGMIFVTGAPFMNDYNVLIPSENGNNKLLENLLKGVNPVKITPIAEVRAQTEVGYKYNIQGVVTSNASGYDKDTAFFDCIYVQDETGGINCFPVSGDFKIGDIVLVKGMTEFYIGEPELQVHSIMKVGETTPIEAEEVTSAQINNRSVEGKLITLNGTVTNITMANGLVESIYIRDAEGVVARAFIDGYITPAKTIDNLVVGCDISVTGLGSYDNTYAIEHDSYARIRVRDRDEIVTSVHIHSEATLPAVPATCTETGLTEGRYCTTCEAVLVAQTEVPALGHSFAEGEILKAATCTETGLKTCVCSACGISEEQIIPATGHTVVTDPAVPATCTERGLTEGQHCSACGEILVAQKSTPILGHTYVNNVCTVCADVFPFIDVPEWEWYRPAVEYCYARKLTNGTSANTYSPEDTLTRAMLVTILYRMAGAPKVEFKGVFTDVADGQWYSSAIQWGYDNGIVKGTTVDTFEPESDVTREQMVTFLYRYAKYVGCDMSKAETTDISGFVDDHTISDYAVEGFRWAIGVGIVNGVGENKLEPLGTATRAHVAQLIMKFDKMING